MGGLIVFDITKKASFEHVDHWLTELEQSTSSKPVILLVGNKLDLQHVREVQVEEAKAYAELKKISYIETSAKDATNVEEAFRIIIEEIFKRTVPAASQGGVVIASTASQTVSLSLPQHPATNAELGSPTSAEGTNPRTKCHC
eukprot:TRINITY_DN1842_c0_g1_i3.p1 TRINITY_DN1842_c0_g1~~TRINITY_DN1842_c0_g1_i3.p1  ORF type:complete len:143 (-),score=35.87 TRINITY_DN1842_c0_g1_i3:116-544(-)